MEHTPPFYSSVDLRNAGFKLAPVDTNLFPGGFNNLKPEILPLAVQAAMVAMEKSAPTPKTASDPRESHAQHLLSGKRARRWQIFTQAGLNVRFGTLTRIKQPTELELPDGGKLTLEPLLRRAIAWG